MVERIGESKRKFWLAMVKWSTQRRESYLMSIGHFLSGKSQQTILQVGVPIF
jgi:hypothetical protein